MSDLFQDAIPDEYITAVVTVMLCANWHTYQVLTKRAMRMRRLLTTTLRHAASALHIWWGVSVEDKKHGLPRIATLRDTPAPIRFLSVEPLLEDLGTIDLTGISWVIVGGESGPGARPMREAWLRAIHHACESAQVPFFFKQWGGVNKGRHGRLLDGKAYDEMPQAITAPIPSFCERQLLAYKLTPLARRWTTTPLVQLATRTEISAA